jgi:PAS domain S-box-containing protein
MKRPGQPHEAPKSRGDWQSFVDVVQDYAIFMLDADGRVATWNRGGEKLKGYSASEIIGRHFSTFYPPEDIAAGKPERELEIARAEGRVEDEGLRVRKDGSLFWANVIITTLLDDEGAVRGYTKVTRDLTERRANEEELRRSEERFRLLVESVTEYAMYMLDPSGNVATWNTGAEKLKGYRAQEIIGQHFSRFFSADDVAAGRPQLELATALSEGRFEEEGYRLRKDGSRFWANVTLTPIRDSRQTLLGFAKVTRDLTSRVLSERVERELVREQAARAAAESAEQRVRESVRKAEEAAQRAEQANRLKDEFLATVSHELRTPLNVIVGWSSILRTRIDEPKAAKGLEVIHRNALAQGRIIEDILDVSRIITGKLRLDIQSVDLCTIVQEAIEVIQPAAAAKDVRITFQSSTPSCMLAADPERLRQIAWNLLSNAAKFSSEGGLIEVLVQARDTSAELSVRDTGLGIDGEFLPFVFDRFKQADSSSTRRIGGLGLGLSIVRHLAELHGGEVRATSEGLGQGATFAVTFPIRPHTLVVPPDSSASQPTLDHAQVPERSLHGVRLLVVDDEPDNLYLLEAALAAAGAEVEVAASTAQAFAAVSRRCPDVLVSDIGMPDEDGYALIRRVRQLPAHAGGTVPAIALSAYTRPEDQQRALAMGFTMHKGKPADLNDLVSAVARLAADSSKRATS